MKVFDFLIMYKLATNYLVFHQTKEPRGRVQQAQHRGKCAEGDHL